MSSLTVSPTARLFYEEICALIETGRGFVAPSAAGLHN